MATTKKLRVKLGDDLATITMSNQRSGVDTELTLDIKAKTVQRVANRIGALNDCLALNGSAYIIPLVDSWKLAKSKYFCEVGRLRKIITFVPTAEAEAEIKKAA